MSTLHTVNKSPFATGALVSCLDHCKDGDAILMIEDGVYGGLTGTTVADRVQQKAGSVAIFVLSPDADARGLATDRLLAGVNGVDYDGFVDLVADHDRTQAWL
ncbi:MAG: sulfurtransferase complex subunit TusB [Rhodobacteraceae bacterium]|jgi:tRNA 2-thiouridine synthesizing protein B|nr:MAG: sulfurtransferase complex subunit TusB [Paracoccaceae bacterium]